MEPETETTTFEQRVLGMTVEEVEAFLSHIDADFEDSILPQADCMLFRSDTHTIKKGIVNVEGVATPTYTIDSKQYSAQRISLILFTQSDPLKKSDIYALCGNEYCIKPNHLRIRKRTNKS